MAPGRTSRTSSPSGGEARRPISLTTLRSDSNSVAMFYAPLHRIPPTAGATSANARSATSPRQICFDWNTPKHTTDNAVPPGRRAFTKQELQRLFDHLDDQVDHHHAAGCQTLAVRSTETRSPSSSATPTDCADASSRCSTCTTSDPTRTFLRTAPSAHSQVRWAKGTASHAAGLVRTVLTVPGVRLGRPDAPEVDVHQDTGVTSRRPTALAGLWPSERGDRASRSGHSASSFSAARNAAGLPKELGLHCLRHSYVTHLIEAGYDPTFVQTQVGHSYASTTSLYTSVSSDFKQKAVQQMIARRIAKPKEIDHE